MNHDIAHCDNSQCRRKNKCYRYLAHLEAKEKQLPYVAYFVMEEHMRNEDYDCNSFWDYEEWISKK